MGRTRARVGGSGRAQQRIDRRRRCPRRARARAAARRSDDGPRASVAAAEKPDVARAVSGARACTRPAPNRNAPIFKARAPRAAARSTRRRPRRGADAEAAQNRARGERDQPRAATVDEEDSWRAPPASGRPPPAAPARARQAVTQARWASPASDLTDSPSRAWSGTHMREDNGERVGT